ncbi:MAG: hypothetical protein AAF492_14405, partial [Verrucomicrobiota bacterium]
DDKTHADLENAVYAREAHNDVIQLLAEFGLVGLACFVPLIGLLIFRAARARHLAALYLLTYWGIKSLFSFPWHTATFGPGAAVLLGLLLAPQASRSSAGLPGLVGATLCLIFFGFQNHLNLRLKSMVEHRDVEELARGLPPWAHREKAWLGGYAASAGAFKTAVDLLEEAGHGYRNPIWFNNLGHALFQERAMSSAMTIYRAWERTGVQYDLALKNLAAALEVSGRPAEAAMCLRKHRGLWPHAESQWMLREGTLFLLGGDPVEALETTEAYLKVCRHKKREPEAEMLNLHGSALIGAGRHHEAVVVLRRALESDATLESARRNLNNLLNRTVDQP